MRLPQLPSAYQELLWQSVAAVLSALLLLLSFPPFDLNFIAWVSLAPLLFVIAGGIGLRRAFWLGWLVGIEFTFFAENWIAHSMTIFGGMLTLVAYSIALLFAAILAIFPAIFAVLMARFANLWGARAVALAPVVWAAVEWVRPYLSGITWNAIGVSQYRYFAVARFAQYGGVYLVSAVVVAGSAVLALLLKSIREKDWKLLRPAVALVACVGLGFQFVASEQARKPSPVRMVTIVGVQPNLPPDKNVTATDLENNIRLTREGLSRAPEKRADIVIWAESPLTLFYETDEMVRAKLDGLANEVGSHLIVNSVTLTGERFFNSVQVINPRSQSPRQKRYDKIRLVPFGEYVPFNAVLKYVVPRVISSDAGGFAAGDEAVVNVLALETGRGYLISGAEEGPAIERTTDFIRVGSFICYEAAYPDLVRQFVRNGATLLVNVSNDAWFGTTAGARQHLAHAVMRAIENDRNLIRVTNSGITALITSEGKIVDPLPAFTAGSQVWQTRPQREMTFYVRHGEWFAAGCAILCLCALAIGFTGIGRKRAEEAH